MNHIKSLGPLSCRVCLSTDITSKIVMSSENGLLDLFYYCFGIQIDLPRSLCGECADNIKKFAEFKKKCLESQTVWKSNYTHNEDFKVEYVKNEVVIEIKDEEDSTESSDHPEIYVQSQESELKIEDENQTSAAAVHDYHQTLKCIKNSNIDFSSSSRIFTHRKVYNDTKNSASCSGDTTHINDSDNSTDKKDGIADKPCTQTKSITEDDSRDIKNDPLKCKCGYEYGSQSFYKMHIKKCKMYKFYERYNDVIQSCGLCKFTTKDVDLLCKHLEDHYKKNVLECMLCDYIGRDFAEMAYHRYTHQNLKTRMFCHKCYAHYATPKTMIFHFRSVHLKKKGGLCLYCDEQLATLTGWDRHELRKHNNEIGREFYFCDCCGVKYTHQTLKNSMFCHKCNQHYSTPMTLMFHFRSAHLKKKGGLCVYCNDSLASIKGWKKHELRKHSDDNFRKFYFCDCCGIKFVYRHEIVKHLRQRAGYYKVVCDECGAEFLRQNNLRSHIRNKHTKHEIVKCPHCDKSMKDINLKKHIENVHGEKKYVCEICSENFRTLVNFKYHMLSHTKERPFKCELCGVDYKNKSTLYMHMMKHKGLKPHVCSVCSKGFSTRNQLLVHGSVHTKVRTVKCGHCDKSFHFKKRLLLHHGRMHPDIPFESGKETA